MTPINMDGCLDHLACIGEPPRDWSRDVCGQRYLKVAQPQTLERARWFYCKPQLRHFRFVWLLIRSPNGRNIQCRRGATQYDQAFLRIVQARTPSPRDCFCEAASQNCFRGRLCRWVRVQANDDLIAVEKAQLSSEI
jgi:hypothetical protein